MTKAVVLSDNNSHFQELECEHGLSIYLETDNYKYLLDTGASGKFIENARKLEIYLEDVDFVFISHGHNDHIGGLSDFLKINSKAKVIISANALKQKYFSSGNSLRDISIIENFEEFYDRFIFIDAYSAINSEAVTFQCTYTDFPEPKANKKLLKMKDKQLTSDNFDHEIVIGIGEKTLLIYTGCTHSGLLNILKTTEKNLHKKISTLIGGFHLPDSINELYESENDLNAIGEQLSNCYSETQFYTGHCTRKKAALILKKHLKNKLRFFYTGYTILIDN